MRVYIESCDPPHHSLLSDKEAIDLFGEEYLEDCGTDIPDDLYYRWKACHDQYWDFQKTIRLLKEKRNS